MRREWLKLTRRASLAWLTVALLLVVAFGLWAAGDQYRQSIDNLALRSGEPAAELEARAIAGDPGLASARADAELLGWPRAASYALAGANILGPFLLAALAAGLIADEHRTGAVRLIWSEGVPRGAVLAAKAAALAGGAAAGALAVAAFGLGGAALLHVVQDIPWLGGRVPAGTLAAQAAATLVGHLLFAGLGALGAVVTRSRLWGTLGAIGWAFAEGGIVAPLLGGPGAFLPVAAYRAWLGDAFAGVRGGAFAPGSGGGAAGAAPLVVAAWAVALWLAAGALWARQEATVSAE